MDKLTNTGKILEISAQVALVLIGVFLRVLPHAPNFTPIAALAIFSGFYFSKKIAFILPIAAMIISDIFIGFYEFKIMAVVYLSFIVCVFMGLWLKNNKKWQTILAGPLFSTFIFFLLTNFAVWAFTPWYDKTFFGISQCYLMALPFLKNTFLGDAFYTAIFFGAYELVKVLIEKKFAVKQLPLVSNLQTYAK